ncbi:MAG TPA: chemotaxis protein CheW [Anaeromyxobacter sp.]|nr:chemotaxis protein CheW [Anaeromyxobacter sp.]
MTEADVVAGKLAARLQGLPEPTGAPGVPDPRFTTWRPGTTGRPLVPEPEPKPVPQPAPSDFAVYDPARSRPPVPDPRAGEPLPFRPIPSAPLPGDRGRPFPERPRPPPAPERDPLDEFFYRQDEAVPSLDALPLDAALPVAVPHEAEGIEEYLIFRLGTEEYGVPVERVHEVLKPQPVTEVPRAPAGVLGVITVRGEVVAVFDPRLRLGLPGSPPSEGAGRIVIVDDGEGPCGLLVDEVASVVRLAQGSIEPCPQGIGGQSADCLAGIGRERNRLFMVLDLSALLRRGAMRTGRPADARA